MMEQHIHNGKPINYFCHLREAQSKGKKHKPS